MIGRKYTFLVTILIMGSSTFIVGILPNYASIGIIAPVVLIVLRLLQGLALGGEYGGAATYVAEHSPHHRRGAYTSWIQPRPRSACSCRCWSFSAAAPRCRPTISNALGWRIPFLVSILLLAISVWIRLMLNESPAFRRMLERGQDLEGPLTGAFARWKNLKVVLLALFGLVAGQAVVWYTGQF